MKKIEIHFVQLKRISGVVMSNHVHEGKMYASFEYDKLQNDILLQVDSMYKSLHDGKIYKDDRKLIDHQIIKDEKNQYVIEPNKVLKLFRRSK